MKRNTLKFDNFEDAFEAVQIINFEEEVARKPAKKIHVKRIPKSAPKLRKERRKKKKGSRDTKKIRKHYTWINVNVLTAKNRFKRSMRIKKIVKPHRNMK